VASLKDILYKVKLISISGATDIAVDAIQFDSRIVGAGDVFVAIKGTQVDGHEFISKAVHKEQLRLFVKIFLRKFIRK